MKKLICKCLGITTMMWLPFSASAAVIYTVDSGYDFFSWRNIGGTSTQGGFDFTLAEAGTLTVTDAFSFGDRFEVLLNNVFVGETTDVPRNGPSRRFGDNEIDNYILEGFSHFTLALDPGTYLLDFRNIQIATASTGRGDAYFRVDTGSRPLPGTETAVPEPGTLSVLLGGMGILGLMLRRRKPNQAIS